MGKTEGISEMYGGHEGSKPQHRKLENRKVESRNSETGYPTKLSDRKEEKKEREEKSKTGGENREKTEIALQNLEYIKYGRKVRAPELRNKGMREHIYTVLISLFHIGGG